MNQANNSDLIHSGGSFSAAGRQKAKFLIVIDPDPSLHLSLPGSTFYNTLDPISVLFMRSMQMRHQSPIITRLFNYDARDFIEYNIRQLIESSLTHIHPWAF